MSTGNMAANWRQANDVIAPGCLEPAITQISRYHHCLTLNFSETVRDADIFTVE